jgi:hypothetical protein
MLLRPFPDDNNNNNDNISTICNDSDSNATSTTITSTSNKARDDWTAAQNHTRNKFDLIASYAPQALHPQMIANDTTYTQSPVDEEEDENNTPTPITKLNADASTTSDISNWFAPSFLQLSAEVQKVHSALKEAQNPTQSQSLTFKTGADAEVAAAVAAPTASTTKAPTTTAPTTTTTTTTTTTAAPTTTVTATVTTTVTESALAEATATLTVAAAEATSQPQPQPTATATDSKWNSFITEESSGIFSFDLFTPHFCAMVRAAITLSHRIV